MLKWWCISRREGGTMVVLPRSVFRFYKVGITGMLQQGETLEGLAVEDTSY